MKKTYLVSLFLLYVPLLFAQTAQTLVKKGQKVPEFKVQMFDGKNIDIQNLRGKVVLLNFWATWCPPCRQELARVQKDIIDRFKGKDFIFLPISRQDSYEKIKTFRQQTGHRFPMGMDPDRKIYSLFATASIPRNFVIDQQGNIVFMEEGYDEQSFQQLIIQIERLLKK